VSAKNGAAKQTSHRSNHGYRNPSKFRGGVKNTQTADSGCGKEHDMQTLKKGASKSTIRIYATRERRMNQALYDETQKNTEIIERKYILKLLYNPIEKVKGITAEQLAKVIAEYPQLRAVYGLVSSYKALFAARRVENLDQWLESAKTLGSPDVDSCVNGINRDIDAVKNAILHSHNNGLAEGSVNKIKRIKYTVYGRASFSTLRTKVLTYENWRFVNPAFVN
jgi:transposase